MGKEEKCRKLNKRLYPDLGTYELIFCSASMGFAFVLMTYKVYFASKSKYLFDFITIYSRIIKFVYKESIHLSCNAQWVP